MTLADPRNGAPTARIGGRATLDELLRRAAQRRPDAAALLDPPYRERFTDGKPRGLSWAQADRMASAIAGRLGRMGLRTDAVVAFQIANTVESVLTLLGILRAGLIAMPLPLLWRRAEAVAALGRVNAAALVVSGRIGNEDYYDLAMRVASELFTVRYVCGFGGGAPDGIVSFDDLFSLDGLDPPPSIEPRRAPGPGAPAAVITWDVSAAGPMPVARSHGELIAGGLAVLLESRIERDAVMLSTLAMSSFASLAVAVVPWLLAGGTLALHHPFEAETFAGQRRAVRPDTIIVPGPLVGELANGGYLADEGLANVIGVWRAPERLARAPAWRARGVRLTDVAAFGEVGLVAACREQGGEPAALPFGLISAPRAPKGPFAAIEIARTATGTVALRGPMVPRAAFPAVAHRASEPPFKAAADGFVDTSYACLTDSAAMVITAPPAGMIGVGGYRFMEGDLQETVRRIGHGGAALAVFPDALAGHRLAGSAADRGGMREALARAGENPLLVAAFGDSALSAAQR